MDVRISIIVPIYNAEEFLDKSLKSAVAQTVSPKEIICIDDGSTDHSREILEKYKKKYDYIIIHEQENSGAGTARNRGLELATGQYVCFLDADDYYMDCTALERMVEACERHHVKVCGSFRCIFNVTTGETKKMSLHRKSCSDKLDGILMRYVDYQDDFHYQSYIFERNMLQDNQITFPEYRRYQDPPFFLRAMLLAKVFWIVPVELYCFKENTDKSLAKKMRMADCLKGIRDNLQLAVTLHLGHLQRRLVNRISHNYLEMILNDSDQETREVLFEIGNILPLEYLKRTVIYYILLIWKLGDINYNLYQYWQEKNIYEIVLYGLGDMARLLFWGLKDSKMHFFCGIDQNVSTFNEIKVFSNYNIIEKNAAIVVTPLNEVGQSIVQELINNHFTNIYFLPELIDEIAQEKLTDLGN